MALLDKVGFPVLFVILLLSRESQGIHWTGPLQGGDVIYSCEKSDVVLPWQYQLEQGEEIADIQWYYEGVSSEEAIGIFAHGQFLAYPVFSNRVSPTHNAGIILAQLLPADTGNYTVVVKGHNTTGHYFELKQSINVQISDQVLSQHGQLEVSEAAEPVKDDLTDQWAIQLQCGVFSFQGKPPYDVQWISPGGHVHGSSHFNGSHFSYLLSSPIEGGHYTCRVPSQHTCGSGHGSIIAEASILVDAMNARLTLLERMSTMENQRLLAEKQRLEQKLNETDGRMETLEEQFHRQAQTIQQLVHENDLLQTSWNVTLKDQLKGLRSAVEEQKTLVQCIRQSIGNDLCGLTNNSLFDRTGACHPDNHTVIDDLRRAVNDTDINDALCDHNIQPGWYRYLLYHQSAVIPTTCVPGQHCHTVGSTWMDLHGQSLPDVGQEIDARACSNVNSDCCHTQTPITVRNCGDYLIYNTQPLEYCYLSFCVESRLHTN